MRDISSVNGTFHIFFIMFLGVMTIIILIFFFLNGLNLEISFWMWNPIKLFLSYSGWKITHFLIINHHIVLIYIILLIWSSNIDFFLKYIFLNIPALGTSQIGFFFFLPARLLSVLGNLLPFSPLKAYGLNF